MSFLSFCVVVAALTFEDSGQDMGGDGFQTQKRKSWLPEKQRGKKLADAITIDGRKEWICKFCSEINVWTWWRCRRCDSHIPAGLQGKYRQAVSAKTNGNFNRIIILEWRRREKSPETRMQKLESCESRLDSFGGRRKWKRAGSAR